MTSSRSSSQYGQSSASKSNLDKHHHRHHHRPVPDHRQPINQKRSGHGHSAKRYSNAIKSNSDSSAVAKQAKEEFRDKISKVVVQCLNAHLRSDCKVGRIRSADDFKFLARKVPHYLHVAYSAGWLDWNVEFFSVGALHCGQGVGQD